MLKEINWKMTVMSNKVYGRRHLKTVQQLSCFVVVQIAIAWFHVHWTIQNHNLSLKVVFLFHSFRLDLKIYFLSNFRIVELN